MRKFLRKFLPDRDSVKGSRWIEPFGAWLHNPNLWHLHRRSVAGGVAIGLFCGLMPGPLQMLSAALMAVLFRVNLPVALFTTLYTNPFTIVPIYLLAYRIGMRVSGSALKDVPHAFPSLHAEGLWSWLTGLGKPLLLGLPLLGISLSIAGYLLVRVLWRIFVVIKWRRRKKRR
jgi:uncharacterized protein